VELNKLAKRFRREMTGNPKKAVLLGLLSLVAMYFWGPLLWRQFAKDEAAVVAVAANPVATAAGPVAQPSDQTALTADKNEAAAIPWQQLAKWMDNDPQATAAKFVAEQRNPFAPTQSKRQPPPRLEQLGATPQSVGLELSSTIIGAKRRVARISGRTYEEGQTIEASKDGQPIAFTLAEVHSRHVVLLRQGEPFQLAIPGRTQSGRIEMTRDGN
jgi:hypothetical protein